MVLYSICLRSTTTRPTATRPTQTLSLIIKIYYKLAPWRNALKYQRILDCLLLVFSSVLEAPVSHRDRTWLTSFEKKKQLQTSTTEKCFNHQCYKLSSSSLSYFLRSKSTCVKPRQKLLIGHSNFYRRKTDKLIKTINIMDHYIIFFNKPSYESP